MLNLNFNLNINSDSFLILPTSTKITENKIIEIDIQKDFDKIVREMEYEKITE